MAPKIVCDCPKDPAYSFGCKNAVVWFAENMILGKIRRLQQVDENLDVSKVIMAEYEKCRAQYKALKKQEPRAESAIQIERDLPRTFPKN